MRRDDVTVFQLHPEHGVGQGVDHGAFHFDVVFFRHNSSRCYRIIRTEKDAQP